MALQVRRGTNTERLGITPLAGELVYTTDTKQLYVGDGSTAGGITSISGTIDSVLADTTPQLGGTLDLNGNDITGTGNINITGTITATGNINLGDGQLTVGRIMGDLIADDSTVVFDATAGTLLASTLTGSATINVTGDVTGSLFADDSTLIVDGVGNTITIQSLLASTTSTNSVTAEGILDLKSNTNVVRTTATGVKLVSQTVGGEIEQGPVHRTTTSRGTLAAPTTVVVGDSILSILGEGYDGAAYKTQAVINIGVSENTVGTEATPGRIDFSIRDDNGTFNTSFARLESNGVFTAPAIQSLGITTTVKNSLLAKVSGGLGLQGTIVYDTTLAGLSYYHGTDGWNNILTGNKPVETTSFIKPGVYADNTARDAVITTPTAGMMVFNTTGTKFQGYTGSAWVDLN